MSYFCIKVLIGSGQRKVYANQIHETKATYICLFDMGFLRKEKVQRVFTSLILENVVQPTKYIHITLYYLTNYDRNY